MTTNSGGPTTRPSNDELEWRVAQAEDRVRELEVSHRDLRLSLDSLVKLLDAKTRAAVQARLVRRGK